MSRVLTFGYALFLCGIFLSSHPVSAAPVRDVFRNGPNYLVVEILENDLYHFEYGVGNGPQPEVPIPTSPQVEKTDYSGVTTSRPSADVFNTRSSTIVIDPVKLCVSLFDSKPKIELTSICPGGDGPSAFEMTLSRGPMENVYGLGEKFREPGNPNGDWVGDVRVPGVDMGNMMTGFNGGYAADMEIPIMYAVGPQNLNYALFADQTHAQTWNFQNNPWTMKTTGQRLRWYLIAGPNLPSLRRRFMELTGRPPVPPKKAFGLWVSEYSFADWNEVNTTLSRLRQGGFPVDGFVMDLSWYGGVKANSPSSPIGTLRWDEKHFPKPAEQIARYRDQGGVGLILIEESYIGERLPEYGLMENNGFLVQDAVTNRPVSLSDWTGEVGMIDWTNPEGSLFWHELKRQPLANMGVFGQWTDLGEPLEPADGGRYHGINGVDGNSSYDIHNFYNFMWHKSIADGYASSGSIQRPFMLSRSGTTGIQRFGGALWSGDLSGKLTTLAAHLNAQMHLSLSGIDYFGADIGGFNRKVNDGDLDEIYTRWFAHGAAFDVPVRPHTDKFDNTYKTSPAEMGWTASNLSNLRQRYELIPYYYTLAHDAWESGEPVFPPLVYYYQNDPKTRTLGSEKMIGRDILVATAASKNWSTDVYLPEGEWVDYYDDTFYESPEGGRTLPSFPFVRGGLFKLPTFVRAGAILPKALVDGQTFNALGKRGDGAQSSDLRLQIFASKGPSQFKVYEDDGQTIKYKTGLFAQTPVSQQDNGDHLTVTISPTTGPYAPVPLRNNIIELMLHEKGRPSRVTLNGKTLEFKPTEKLARGDQGWTSSAGRPNRLLIQTGPQPIGHQKSVEVFF